MRPADVQWVTNHIEKDDPSREDGERQFGLATDGDDQ